MENHYSTPTNNDTIHTKFYISNEMECSRRSSGEDTAVSSSYGDSKYRSFDVQVRMYKAKNKRSS